MTKGEIKEFFRYISKETVNALVSVPKMVWHNLKQPKTWMFIIFAAFIWRFVFVRQLTHWADKLILFALIIIVLWGEYKKGDWKAEWRSREREKIEKEVREKMRHNNS